MVKSFAKVTPLAARVLPLVISTVPVPMAALVLARMAPSFTATAP